MDLTRQIPAKSCKIRDPAQQESAGNSAAFQQKERVMATSRKASSPSGGGKPVNLGRHAAECKICAHPHRSEIETEFVGWGGANQIAKVYGVSRDGVYRHAHALDLFRKRQRNIRAALEKIIERAGEVDVNAASVVAAVAAYAKINGRGEWIERAETLNLNDLFERMTAPELEAYASDGILPSWFETTVGATASPGEREPNGS
jgi:hypothetical protein